MKNQCKFVHSYEHRRCEEKTYGEYEYCREHISPCPYKTKTDISQCGKLPQIGSCYCPKHALMIQEEPAERQRWAERMARHRERKASERAALENSPLRADAYAKAVHSDVG